MSDKIRISTGPNEVTIAYGAGQTSSTPTFSVRVRTAKNAHINVPVGIADIKALQVWLTRRIAEAEKVGDESSDNQLDMFQV